LRGLGIGIYFFAVNIAAYAIGAPLTGKLNDILGADRNPQMMRYSLLISPLVCVASALLLWRGGRELGKHDRPA
jgi:MFS family permease